jgi:hypothetical protein
MMKCDTTKTQKPADQPLNLLEIAALYLHEHGPARAASIQRHMYLTKWGQPTPEGSNYYNQYFRVKGTFTDASRYVLNGGSAATALWRRDDTTMLWSLTERGKRKAERAREKLAGLRGQLLAHAPAGEKAEAASLVAQRDARGGIEEAAKLLVSSLPKGSTVTFKHQDEETVIVSAHLMNGSSYLAPTRLAFVQVYDFVKRHIEANPVINRQAIIDALSSCLAVSTQYSTSKLFDALKALRPDVTQQLFTIHGATHR